MNGILVPDIAHPPNDRYVLLEFLPVLHRRRSNGVRFLALPSAHNMVLADIALQAFILNLARIERLISTAENAHSGGETPAFKASRPPPHRPSIVA